MQVRSPEVEKEFQRQLEILQLGAVEVTPHDEFKHMLYDSIEKKIPLRVKYGIDPTNKDVHVGHLVPCRKMRQFQDLGHKGVVIIGDYTARIGDPTGKVDSRPQLTEIEVKQNAKDYMQQIFSVLDPTRTEIRYQSEWFNKVGLSDVMGWAMQTTVAKLLSHETFAVRLKENRPLGLHELFYPVLQGIDSVFMSADVELGGSDQKFNVLMGRDYQKIQGMRPQVAILMPILTGTCGTLKMSKSLGNYIGVMDSPFEKFGKIMSIPDHLMLHYYQYVAGSLPQELRKIEEDLANQALHPNEAKKRLASKIVSDFHGKEVGAKMREQFESVFAQGHVPDDVDVFIIHNEKLLVEVLVEQKLVVSNSEARRLIKQNAISFINGDKVSDLNFMLNSSHKGKTLKVGKRKFLKLV